MNIIFLKLIIAHRWQCILLNYRSRKWKSKTLNFISQWYAILLSAVYTVRFFYLNKDHSLKTNIRKCVPVLDWFPHQEITEPSLYITGKSEWTKLLKLYLSLLIIDNTENIEYLYQSILETCTYLSLQKFL